MDFCAVIKGLGSCAPFDGEDVMAKKKRKQGSVSLRPVVDAIEDTIAKLTRAKKKASARGKNEIKLRIRSMRSLRHEAMLRCKALDLWIPHV